MSENFDFVDIGTDGEGTIIVLLNQERLAYMMTRKRPRFEWTPDNVRGIVLVLQRFIARAEAELCRKPSS